MTSTFRILGSGPSTGVPIPACRCSTCRSPHLRNSRLRSSALFTTTRGVNVLIDTSPDLRQQALRYEICSIDAVLLTHSHADHIIGFDDLRSFNFIQRRPIPCYGTLETLSALQRTFYYVVNPPPEYKGGMLANVDFRDISPVERFSAAGLQLQAFPLVHGDVPVTGFRCGNLAYATDCSAIPDETKDLLRGVEHLVIDGLRERPHATHFSISEAAAAARELGARRVYLTHLSHEVEYETVSRSLPPGVELAYDGLTIAFEPYSEES